MKFIHASFVLFTLFSLGCYSNKVGTRLSTEQTSQIKQGMARQEVERILGKPGYAGPDGQGGMVVHYIFVETKVRGSTYIPIAGSFVGGTDTEQKQFQVYYDSNDRVKKVFSTY